MNDTSAKGFETLSLWVSKVLGKRVHCLRSEDQETHLADKFFFKLISVIEVLLTEPSWTSFWRPLLSALSDMFGASYSRAEGEEWKDTQDNSHRARVP
jgi:hypothetical protein